MSTPSHSCANGHARDVGWLRVARLIFGVVCVLSLMLALPALPDASPRTAGHARAIAAASRCTASAPDTADDPFDAIAPAYESDHVPNDSIALLFEEFNEEDEEDRERVSPDSLHGHLARALGLRRPSHVWKASLTPDDGSLPHQFLIDSVRRL